MDEQRPVVKPVGYIKSSPGFFDNPIVRDIFETIVVPFVKSIIAAGVDRVLWGPGGSPNSASRAGLPSPGRISYRGRFENQRERPDYLRVVSQVPRLDDLVFEKEQDAQALVDALYDKIDRYGTVTIGDLYELIGVNPPDFTVNKFGWNNAMLSQYEIRSLPAGGVRLVLPNSRPIQ